MTKFLKSKGYTTAGLQSYIAKYTTPARLTRGAVRTYNDGEFMGTFQCKLDGRGITHQLTLPDTPQYNGVAERVLGLLREKTIAT